MRLFFWMRLLLGDSSTVETKRLYLHMTAQNDGERRRKYFSGVESPVPLTHQCFRARKVVAHGKNTGK